MKKTLLVCDLYPLPENMGSNMRTMNLVRFFQNYGSVDVAYTTVLPGAQEKNTVFSKEYILKKKDYPKGILKRFIMLIKGVPYPIHEYDNVSHEKVISLIESSEYDYILVRYIQNAISFMELPVRQKSKIIVDFDDLITHSLYEVLFYPTKNLFKRFARGLNKILLNYYQKRCLRFGASLFCSEKDERQLTKTDVESNTFVVPNTYDNNLFKDYDFGDGFCNGHTLLFVGALLYPPNARALTWFITSIYSTYKAHYPDAKLMVVGRSPTSEIASLCEGIDGVELYQDVPDVKLYYKQCRAVVIPILEGGGTRIKILESALANRPILSTPQGVDGLDLYDDKDILQFRDGPDFLEAYRKLLDKDKYNSLVCNAKECVVAKYSTQSLNFAMERVLNSIDKIAINNT
jgi:glycosyltransferase involved in cell wall biosynthesis